MGLCLSMSWRTCLVTCAHFTGVKPLLSDNCCIAVFSYKYPNAVCGGVAGNVLTCWVRRSTTWRGHARLTRRRKSFASDRRRKGTQSARSIWKSRSVARYQAVFGLWRPPSTFWRLCCTVAGGCNDSKRGRMLFGHLFCWLALKNKTVMVSIRPIWTVNARPVFCPISPWLTGCKKKKLIILSSSHHTVREYFNKMKRVLLSDCWIF